VPQRRQALERLVLHATSLRIPVVEVEGGSLTAVAGFDGHQGIALVVEPRTFAGLDDILARAVERGEPPFVLVLDSLEDPQNVGTLLRSAEAAGVHGVLFPTHRQAPLSPAAVKASAGAVEHLLLCPVDDLAGALSDLRIRGLRIAAAEADAPLTIAQADLRGPLAIVVGSEGQGLTPAIRRRADVAVRIPMRGAIGSLNAAVAGSILLFSAVGQRDPGGQTGADRPRPATWDDIAGTSADGDTDTPHAPDAPVAHDAVAPAPRVPATPARRSKKGLSTEEAASPTPTEAADPTDPPLDESAGETADPESAAAGETADPEPPAARETADREPAADAATTVPKPSRRRASTTRSPELEAPAEPAAEPKRPRRRASKSHPGNPATAAPDAGSDDDLLPGGPTPE
jgi:23S rRNA (guanosine2251-2'-O)-methyltransferase